MASFADVQYCIYAVIVAGSEEFQNYADVINGWSQGKYVSISRVLMYYPLFIYQHRMTHVR